MTTYYDQPLLKEPVWIWSVPAYFYAGGLAGAASVLGAAAQLLDRDGLNGLVRRCRLLAAGACVAGSLFLVQDLGRKERFLNMLRVVRPTSPMSVGSWVLAGSSGAAGAAALLRDHPLGDAAALAAGGLGLPLAGYTAVLLTNTAVPVWNQSRRALPVLFVSSAVTSLVSVLELTHLDPREAGVVRRLGLASRLTELVAGVAVEAEAGEAGVPYRQGLSGALYKAAQALIMASLVAAARGQGRRALRSAAGILGTAGSLTLRFGVFHAGRASARDSRPSGPTPRA